MTPSFIGSYVTIAADRVENFDYFGYSGTLRLEYWAFPTPFTGAYQFGYQMALTTLGQLSAGQYYYAISRYVPASLPPSGYYCPSLILTEYTIFGYTARDWVNFSCRYIGTPPSDLDSDGWIDAADNCLLVWNPSQSNSDSDRLGDACDACPYDSANDADGDSWCANADNCPLVSNANQANADGDSLGDRCDVCPLDAANDSDGDGRCANQDNCAAIYNPSQRDSDRDGIGDACDPYPVPESDATLGALVAIAGLLCVRSRRVR